MAQNRRVRQFSHQSIWDPADEMSPSSEALLLAFARVPPSSDLSNLANTIWPPLFGGCDSGTFVHTLGLHHRALSTVLPVAFHHIEVFQKVWKRQSPAMVPPELLGQKSAVEDALAWWVPLPVKRTQFFSCVVPTWYRVRAPVMQMDRTVKLQGFRGVFAHLLTPKSGPCSSPTLSVNGFRVGYPSVWVLMRTRKTVAGNKFRLPGGFGQERQAFTR